MSNHQKGTNVAELIGPLLKRLKLAKDRVPENSEMEKIIEQISKEVEKTKKILDSREILDKELAGYLGKIEKQIDPLIDRKPLHKPCVKASDLPQKATITEVGQSSNQSYQMDEDPKFEEFWVSLDRSHRIMLDMLAVIPENAEVKKRFLIYWWTIDDLNVGFSKRHMSCYTINFCEGVFSDMVDKNFLIPVVREHNKAIDRVTIERRFHKWLISNRERSGNALSEKREEGSWCFYMGMLLNIDQKYLDSKDIIGTMNKCDELAAVQLGSWCYTTKVHNGVKKTGPDKTKLKNHIEVDQTDFLQKLGKHVRYLSLRGISRIVEIPKSIGQLEQLRILDLRACHNLEKLPQKPRVCELRWFEHLEILDISNCYLLNHMPKWICEVYTLRVLKGFVVGSLRHRDQSSHLGDLSKLYFLTKLSIRISNNILGPEVFRGFNSLNRLLILTIIWSQNKEIPTYSLPKTLEKLDIRCYSEADVLSKLQNPEELTNLKRLYIRGGNLTKIPCHDNWNVEILRLRFLNKLVYPANWEELRTSFKNLKYVEYERCTKPKNFPNDGNNWHNEERAEAIN